MAFKMNYKEISGRIIEKNKNFLGKYYFKISDGTEIVKVFVGKGLYDFYDVNKEVTIGYINRKLINIRPISAETK